MAEPTGVPQLVKQLLAGASPEQSRAIVEALISGRVSGFVEQLPADPAPIL